VLTVYNVANNKKKNTAAGIAKRAAANARRVIEKSKNLSKNKAVRRVVDDLLVNPGSLVSVPGMSMASSVYKQIKVASRSRSAKPQGVVVSPCLKQWYTCLTDPFSASAAGACIPTGGNHASARNFGYLRFDVTIGTGGIGLLAIMPTACANNPSIIYSGSGYLGTFAAPGPLAISTIALSAGLNTLTTSNNRYSYGQLTTPNLINPLVNSRLVGGGLRVQYTGKAINLGGLMYMYTSPVHAPAEVDPVDSLPMGPGDLSGYQECIIKPITREPQEFTLAPQRETELEYNDGSSTFKHVYPWSVTNQVNTYVCTPAGASGPIAAPSTLIYFTGTATETIHVEYGMHVEATGPATEGQRLPADSDPVGVDNMMAAISNATINIASSKGGFPEALRKAYSNVEKHRKMTTRL